MIQMTCASFGKCDAACRVEFFGKGRLWCVLLLLSPLASCRGGSPTSAPGEGARTPSATPGTVLRSDAGAGLALLHSGGVVWALKDVLDDRKKPGIFRCEQVRQSLQAKSFRICSRDSDCIGSLACVAVNHEAAQRIPTINREWRKKECDALLDCSRRTPSCVEGVCEQR
jgi:hypothetical protein